MKYYKPDLDLKVDIRHDIPDKKIVVHDNLPIVPFYATVVGAGTSGKTVMLVNMIRWYKHVFEGRILVFTSSYSNTLQKLIQDVGGRIYNSLEDEQNENRIEKVLKFQRERKKSELKLRPVLILCDDFIDNSVFNKRRSVLTKCYSMARHFNVSIITTSQSLSMLPLNIRKLSLYNFFYKPSNSKERDLIVLENSSWLEEDDFKKLLMDVTGTRYSFLMVDNVKGRILRNFDEVINEKD